MVPTKDRNHSSIYVSLKGHGFLFDCGEGTQRQIKMAGVRPSRIDSLIISHWHGDHVLGIPGLLQTLGHNDYDKNLKIYGPRGTKKYMSKTFDFFATECRVPYEAKEIGHEDMIEDNEDYSIKAYKLVHAVDCLGYVIEEKSKRRINRRFIDSKGIPDGPLLGKLQKGLPIDWKGEKIMPSDATYMTKGKKLGIIFDTKLCDSCFKIAEDTDMLICESTFTDKLRENAEHYKHMTARQAGRVAKDSGAKKLILNHFSQRYKEPKELLNDAKKEFDNTFASEDLMKITL